MTDDTEHLQALINACEEHGEVSLTGTLYVNAEKGLNLKSRMTLRLDGTLNVLPTASGAYAVLKLYDVEDVTITGEGTIKGDRYAHLGQGGEFGHAIEIIRGKNIVISGLTLRDCWGDGIAIDQGKPELGINQNITIEGVKSINNRRQGLSVMGVNTLVVRYCIFADIGGTAPGDGIDLETDTPYKTIENVIIAQNQFKNTKGSNVAIGFEVGSYRNIHVYNNTHDRRSQPIAIMNNIGKFDVPAWARLQKALLSWWDGYRYWGYPTEWRGP